MSFKTDKPFICLLMDAVIIKLVGVLPTLETLRQNQILAQSLMTQ